MAYNYNAYKGNNDFRGFLAANNPGLLKFTGNDGNINGQDYLRATGQNMLQNNAQENINHMRATVGSLFNRWKNNQVQPPEDGGGGGGTVWVGNGTSGGGSGYSAQAAAESKAKADAIAQYDETVRSANDAMAGLGHQQAVGEHNINQDINRQRNKLDANFNQSRGLYDMNTNDAITNNRNTRQQIAENAREQTRGLQQIFAAGGAGDSSFSKIVAPFEVGKAATRQQSAVQDAYAKNRRDLDINWNNVKNAYDENVNELNANRENRLNRLRAEVEGTRNDLAEKIRQANIGKSTANGQGLAAAIASQDGARREINDRRNNITNLGKDVAVAMKDVGWKAPKLESYADKAAGVEVRTGNADQAGLQDQLSLNLQSLLDQDKKKREVEA